MIDVSFIVPVYNVQDYILECIESLLKIDEINYEIIIVNDGSTDESIQKIQHLLNIPVIKLINQENKGLSGARNTGLQEAYGEYVSFIDSDDKIDATALIDLYRKGSKTLPDIIVGDYLYWIGTDLMANDKTLPSDKKLSGTDLLIEYYERYIDSVTWRNLYNRKFLLFHKLFFVEGIYFEDVEWMPKVFYCAKNISYHKIPFYHYRCRPNSITTSEFSKKKFEDCLRISASHLSLAVDMEKEIKKVFLRNSFYCFYKAISSYPAACVESQNTKMQLLLTHVAKNGTFTMKLLAFCYKHFPQTTCLSVKIVGATVRLYRKSRV